MSDAKKEPGEKKAGRKPRAVPAGADKTVAKTTGTATKTAAAKGTKKPVAEKKAAPKTAKAAVVKKVVQTPGADPAPQVVTQKLVGVAEPQPKVSPVAGAAAPAVKSASRAEAPKESVAEESLLAEGLRKFKNWDIGISVKVILVLVVIGIIASILKHF